MGNFENLDTQEPLAKRMERHAFDRLIVLSDGVFAIAITLAALEIRLPDNWKGLGQLWGEIKFSLFAYLISFAVVAAYWGSQRELIARLVRVDRTFTMLTLLQLMFVALVPTATQLLYRHGPTSEAMQVYSATLATCGFLAAISWAYGTLKPDLIHPEARTPYRWVRIAIALIVPLIFVWVGVSGGRDLTVVLFGVVGLVVVRRVVLPRIAHRYGEMP